MEIEVKADPRNPDRRIFAFYDVTDVHQLRRQLNSDARFFDLIGESDAMQSVFQQIEAVARVDTTVLVEGETGTGKELVARAIHGSSPRKDEPFIAVNCAALTESLAASQLFGHKRGSFTGALSDEPGYFGAANRGTLFLDEIGDIPLDVQVNLLRVLEEYSVTRIGETKPRKVNVRIIAASHRNLLEEVEAGRFRQDLLYRIRVARIDLPPLCSRAGDIPLLADRFLHQFATRIGKEVTGMSNAAMRCLLDYPWPGNVRELRNAIEYAAIRTRGPILQPTALPPEVRSPTAASSTAFHGPGMTERDRLLAALRHTGGNRKEAATLLGISRATFYRRLAEFELT
jgi:DNA-binding NtrC family response regulator